MFSKMSLKAIVLVLVGIVSAMAGDYNFLVINETTKNSGADLYVILQYKNERGRTQNSSCTALRSYDDDMFYFKATIDAESEPKLTFYTNRNCVAISSIGSISPFAGTELVSENIIITINDAGVTQTNSSENITPPDESVVDSQFPKKVVRFFAPWTNTSAVLYVLGGESAKMTTVKNYCGWFEAKINKPEGSLQVYFMQTIGHEYVTDIHHSSTITPIAQSTLLLLDEAVAEVDTVWVMAGKDIGTATTVYTKYPGILGNCPTKTIPVMMFDWLHGTKGDGDGEGKNGDPSNGVSADFGSGGCGHHTLGMVEPLLGSNGVPVPAANFPENCKITTHLAQWFLPEVITQKNGQPVTNATCRSIELNLDNDGLWLGQKDKSSPEGGLFLLDDFEYLDAERTIPNPYFDNISNGGKKHNYGFTMKIQATFEYIPGQYFEFFGDDDVWVFINNRLVVDIGGQHAQVAGAVDLDTLGLTEGVNYPFHIFYAERHTSESNFMMRTSIDLKIESNSKITFKEHSSDSTIIKKEIWQNVSESALSCDFSANKHAELAPSNFTLFGGNLSTTGVELNKLDSAYYGGILITNDYTVLSIDSKSISQAKILAPGSYLVRVSLKSDPNEFEDVYFTIDSYSNVTSSSSMSDAKSSSSGKNENPSSSASSSDSKEKNDNKPNFFVRMTGSFEFEIVMDDDLPSLAKQYAVLDMKGQVISVGELNSKEAHVKVPTPGVYVVRVGLGYKRVNVKK